MGDSGDDTVATDSVEDGEDSLTSASTAGTSLLSLAA
jgi:hypothetical protein